MMNYKTHTMKRGVLVTLCLMVIGFSTYAQESREKLKAMKVAYFTEKLSLTPEEAEGFWPLYNSWETKSYELRKEERKINKNIKENFHTLNDSELEALINQQIEIKQKQLDLVREYNGKYKAVIPMKKIALLYTVERQWKRELLQKLHHHRGER